MITVCRPTVAAWLLPLLLSGVSVAAQAQSTLYRCPSDSGGGAWSDRPCNAQGRSAIVVYGPVAEPARPSGGGGYAPLVRRAPEHQAYLSPRCAQLNDALRTAPNRGVKGQTLQDLHDTYRRDCAEDEQAALQQLSRERSEQRAARAAQQKAEQAARDQQRLQREQCDEMMRILQSRRQHIDSLNDGQRADLQRFQDSYRQRCRPTG